MSLDLPKRPGQIQSRRIQAPRFTSSVRFPWLLDIPFRAHELVSAIVTLSSHCLADKAALSVDLPFQQAFDAEVLRDIRILRSIGARTSLADFVLLYDLKDTLVCLILHSNGSISVEQHFPLNPPRCQCNTFVPIAPAPTPGVTPPASRVAR